MWTEKLEGKLWVLFNYLSVLILRWNSHILWCLICISLNCWNIKLKSAIYIYIHYIMSYWSYSTIWIICSLVHCKIYLKFNVMMSEGYEHDNKCFITVTHAQLRCLLLDVCCTVNNNRVKKIGHGAAIAVYFCRILLSDTQQITRVSNTHCGALQGCDFAELQFDSW